MVSIAVNQPACEPPTVPGKRSDHLSVPDSDKHGTSRRHRLAKENVTTLPAFQRLNALAFVLAVATATNILAQQTASDSDAPETMGAEIMPEQGTGSALQQAQAVPTDQPDMTGDSVEQGTMPEGMMNHRTMGGPIEQ